MSAWFYILRLKFGDLYVGSTTNLEKRYQDHCSGRTCRTTKFDPPISIVYSEEYETFSEARQRETQLKHWSRAKKEALGSSDIAELRKLSRSRKKIGKPASGYTILKKVAGVVEKNKSPLCKKKNLN
jgi:putative endonuclease